MLNNHKILFGYIVYDCLGRLFHLSYCAKTISHIFQTCPPYDKHHRLLKKSIMNGFGKLDVFYPGNIAC